PGTDRVADFREHDRNRACCLLRSGRGERRVDHDDVHARTHQLAGKARQACEILIHHTPFDCDVLALLVVALYQRIAKVTSPGGVRSQGADAWNLRRLGAVGEGGYEGQTKQHAVQYDHASHRITSSARIRSSWRIDSFPVTSSQLAKKG